jgi:hypothetical protein
MVRLPGRNICRLWLFLVRCFSSCAFFSFSPPVSEGFESIVRGLSARRFFERLDSCAGKMLSGLCGDGIAHPFKEKELIYRFNGP